MGFQGVKQNNIDGYLFLQLHNLSAEASNVPGVLLQRSILCLQVLDQLNLLQIALFRLLESLDLQL